MTLPFIPTCSSACEDSTRTMLAKYYSLLRVLVLSFANSKRHLPKRGRFFIEFARIFFVTSERRKGKRRRERGRRKGRRRKREREEDSQ